jgi:signal transduction histidine kinase
VTASFQTSPGPGAHGEHLAVSAALVIFAVGTIGAVRLGSAETRPQLLLILSAVLSAATLVGLQSKGAAFLGLFPAVSAAALRFPAKLGAGVAVIGGVAVAVAYTAHGGQPVAGVIFNEVGIAAFSLLSSMARRLSEANAQARGLIAELEESRAAQAQAAALGERQRLAREMHDVLAHSLSGLVLNLEGARLVAERGDTDPQVAEAIGRAHRLAKTGLEEARRAIGMLHGDALPGPERIAELVADFELDTGVVCRFEIDGDRRELASDRRLTFYRVAQEALTNIRKHACAGQVTVSLSYEVRGTRLTIEDVGRDGEHAAASGGGTGYGLAGMRERAELLGGTLLAGPTDHGFRVELWAPG